MIGLNWKNYLGGWPVRIWISTQSDDFEEQHTERPTGIQYFKYYDFLKIISNLQKMQQFFSFFYKFWCKNEKNTSSHTSLAMEKS